MEVDACAFDATAEAVDDLRRLLCSSLEILDINRATVRSTFAIRGFRLRRCFLAIRLVDVSAG